MMQTTPEIGATKGATAADRLNCSSKEVSGRKRATNRTETVAGLQPAAGRRKEEGRNRKAKKTAGGGNATGRTRTSPTVSRRSQQEEEEPHLDAAYSGSA